MLVWCGFGWVWFVHCGVWGMGHWGLRCGGMLVWCGLGIMVSVYLSPYIFNVERASADAPRGSMKYQLIYLNIR